jgi:hypothetical protein
MIAWAVCGESAAAARWNPDRNGRYQRGIRNGSIACTMGMRKRSSDRLSCMTSTRSPCSLADSCERA